MEDPFKPKFEFLAKEGRSAVGTCQVHRHGRDGGVDLPGDQSQGSLGEPLTLVEQARWSRAKCEKLRVVDSATAEGWKCKCAGPAQGSVRIRENKEQREQRILQIRIDQIQGREKECFADQGDSSAVEHIVLVRADGDGERGGVPS